MIASEYVVSFRPSCSGNLYFFNASKFFLLFWDVGSREHKFWSVKPGRIMLCLPLFFLFPFSFF